jgi:phenylacetate-CoA ligase
LRDGFYGFHEFDFSGLNLRLGGRLFVASGRRRPPYWIRDYIGNQLLFSVYHLGNERMDAFVEALERYRPEVVTGYPSAMHLLARACHDLGSSYRPRRVFSDSETVLDYQRAEVAKVWGCDIVDYYGMEVGWVVGQCRDGNYHISPLTSVVEVLDEAGDSVRPGEVGEIVVTDLTNPLMPLIRYRTGDLGAWASKPCECGWNTPALSFIEGRLDDVVVLPDGRKIGRLDHIFKFSQGIKEAQIVQEKPDYFFISVVPEDGYSDAVEEGIVREARARLGNGVTVEVRRVESIPRTARGKFRSVISLVENQQK